MLVMLKLHYCTYIDHEHRWRREGHKFDVTTKVRDPPRVPPGVVVMNK